MMTPGEIRPDMRIRDVIALFPSTRAIFERHRLESCCGGVHSIAAAALARGLDPDSVLAEIRHAADA
jgi:iron-sulfur cluster repair protein YtfE (RIC family)